MAEKGVCYRFVLAINGTRGDFQPYLSLSLGLLKHGHRVKMYTSSNNCKIASDFGVDAEIVFGDMTELLQDENSKRAMEAGDFLMMAKAFDVEETGPKLVEGTPLDEWRRMAIQSYKKFAPNVYIMNDLGHVPDVYAALPDVPRLVIALQPQSGPPSNSFNSVLWAREFPEPDTPPIFSHIWFAQAAATARHREVQMAASLVANGKMDPAEYEQMEGAERVFHDTFEWEKHCVPRLLAYSPSVFPPPDDWPKQNVIIIGSLKLTKDEQDVHAKSGNRFFTMGKEHEECSTFINAGSPPVYIGWGSMIVYGSAHMTQLAVGALRRAGQRGVVVSGWAGLSPADLVDLPELREYAARNVLFVKAAPHEWLFPQCACCVHHGGIGTLQASLGAGVPTIITPVFADQETNAAALVRGGWGARTTKLGRLGPDELGSAIRTVCSDPSFRERTTTLREQMEREDGVGRTIELLTAFVRDEVLTGRYKERNDAEKEALKKDREKNKLLSVEQVIARWNAKLSSKFPAYMEYSRRSFSFAGTCNDIITAGRCWWVKASSCLAREGEGLKSKEVGRFKMWCFLEELEKKGTRLRVRKLKGYGPDEGWVSHTASGKDILGKVSALEEVGQIHAAMFRKMFEDLQ